MQLFEAGSEKRKLANVALECISKSFDGSEYKIDFDATWRQEIPIEINEEKQVNLDEILRQYRNGEISANEAYEKIMSQGLESEEKSQKMEELIRGVGGYSGTDVTKIQEAYLSDLMRKSVAYIDNVIAHQLEQYNAIFVQYIPEEDYDQEYWFQIEINGETRITRLDCSGYVSACLWALGIDIATNTSGNFYKKSPDYSNELIRQLENYGFVWYDLDDIDYVQAGDIYCKSEHVGIAASDEINGQIPQTFDWMRNKKGH